MKDNIFAELYNKILGFFRQTEDASKDVACNRLRVVLMQDRTNLTPQLLERMRKELVELLSKYLEMDKEALELNLDQEGEQMALMLSIPVIRAKDEEEIEKALAETSEENSEDIEENTEETSGENSEDIEENTEETSGENSEDIEEESSEDIEEDTEDDTEQDAGSKKADKQSAKPVKKFPNKEICGDCRECELSDDIECEKKNGV